MGSIEEDIAHEFEVRTPPLLQCSFSEAVKQAHQRGKYLGVYLHNAMHESTAAFLANVFNDTALLQSELRDKVLWFAVDVDTADGFALQSRFNCTTFPCVGVMFRDKQVTVVQGCEILQPSSFLKHLLAGMELWEPLMAKEISYIADRERREMERIQEETEKEGRIKRDKELLAAFEAKEAERKRQREEQERISREEADRQERMRHKLEEERQEEEKRKQRQRDEEEAAKDALTLERSLAASRSPEPPSDSADPSTVLGINLRYPKFAVERKFFYTDSIEGLYSFAESTEGYTGRPIVLMLSGMPPTPIEKRSGVTLREVVGSQKRVAIMVKEL